MHGRSQGIFLDITRIYFSFENYFENVSTNKTYGLIPEEFTDIPKTSRATKQRAG